MIDRHHLVNALEHYRHSEEQSQFIPLFSTLLEHPDAFLRTHLPGHITGSAWVVNEGRTQALLVHHAKLNKWVQPGGHADGEEDVFSVALREAQEETGLSYFSSDKEIFDIDIHLIPERKDFPAHYHYDVRFLLVAKDGQSVVVSDESHDVRWFAFHQIKDLTNERSVLRMVDKIRARKPLYQA
ncbi:MAG: NUDIX hydrolase [Flammeovirgaceae bacterium]